MLILFVTLLLLIMSTPVAFAADYRVSGRILDQKNNPVTQGAVVFSDASGRAVAAATSDISGMYDMTVPEGTYTITIQAPEGSGLNDTTLAGQAVNEVSVRDFILDGSKPVVARKPSLIQRLTLFIVGTAAVFVIAGGGYIAWRSRKKPSPQPGSPD